jgi:hypothetical protein
MVKRDFLFFSTSFDLSVLPLTFDYFVVFQVCTGAELLRAYLRYQRVENGFLSKIPQ